jgi:5-methylcytosine-specific restriction endonuclease McrA
VSGTWTEPPGWRALRKAVFATKGRFCWWCGQPAGTVDHVLPVVLGGGHELANLVPACKRCNYSRGAAVGNRLRGGRPAVVRRPFHTSRRW